MNRLNWNSQTAEGVCVTFFSKYVSFSICLCVKKHEKPFFLKYLENEWTDWAEIHTHYPRWSERCNKQCKKITFVCLFVRCLSVKTHKKTFLQIARKLKGRLSWNSFTTPMLVKGVTSVTFFVQMWHFVYLFAHKKQWQIIFFSNISKTHEPIELKFTHNISIGPRCVLDIFVRSRFTSPPKAVIHKSKARKPSLGGTRRLVL